MILIKSTKNITNEYLKEVYKVKNSFYHLDINIKIILNSTINLSFNEFYNEVITINCNVNNLYNKTDDFEYVLTHYCSLKNFFNNNLYLINTISEIIKILICNIKENNNYNNIFLENKKIFDFKDKLENDLPATNITKKKAVKI